MSRAFDYCKAVYEKANEPENRMFSYDDKSIEVENTGSIIKRFLNSDKDFPINLVLEEESKNGNDSRTKNVVVSFNNDADFNITISSMIGYNKDDDTDYLYNVLIAGCFKYIFEEVVVPEEYYTDEYRENFWNYDMEYEFGNVILCKSNKKVKTKVMKEDGTLEDVEYENSYLATIPFRVQLNKK